MNNETIEVNGKKYTLQHPGNREWLKLKKEFFSFSDGGVGTVDMETLIDYCFEHVVFPEEGPQLSLDDVDIKELGEVWEVILPSFLRGNMETGYKYPDSKKGGIFKKG